MNASGPQRLARLLALIPWLARQDGVTITEAAEHFGIGPEELENDLWLVICCGLPGHGPDQLIDIQFWGDDGVIDVIDPQTLVAPTRLTIEEAASLQVGLTILAGIADRDDRDLIDTTMRTLSQATGITAEAIAGDQAASPPMRTDTGVDPAVASTVQRALAEKSAVRIEYYGASRDALTDRIVWPTRLIVSGSVAYVEAWCTEARDHRTFRLDRIRSAHPAQDAPSPRLPSTARKDTPPSTGGATTVTVSVHRDARWILDTYGFEVIDPPSDTGPAHWIAASIEVWDPGWLVRTVLGMGGQVIVRSPDNVREAVRDAAERALHDPG